MPNTTLMNEAKNFTPFDDTRREHLIALAKREGVDTQDDSGQTALIKAIVAKNYELAHFLVTLARADFNIKDNLGSTAAEYFAMNEQEIETKTAAMRDDTVPKVSRYVDAQKFLSAFFDRNVKQVASASPSTATLTGNSFVKKPNTSEWIKQLFAYACAGDLGKAEKLKNLDQYINQTDSAGKNALMLALENGHFVFANWLVEKSINLGAADHSGKDIQEYFIAAKKIYDTKKSLTGQEAQAVHNLGRLLGFNVSAQDINRGSIAVDRRNTLAPFSNHKN